MASWGMVNQLSSIDMERKLAIGTNFPGLLPIPWDISSTASLEAMKYMYIVTWKCFMIHVHEIRNKTKHPWVEGIQVSSNEGPCPFPRGDNGKKVKLY